MFSTDKNVLVVPNTNVPDFGYVSFLEGDNQTINTQRSKRLFSKRSVVIQQYNFHNQMN